MFTVVIVYALLSVLLQSPHNSYCTLTLFTDTMMRNRQSTYHYVAPFWRFSVVLQAEPAVFLLKKLGLCMFKHA